MQTQSHLSYHIHGNDIQVLEVALAPNQKIVAAAGMLNFMDAGIQLEARMSDGSSGSSLVSASKRALSGESLFLTHFSNRAQTTKHIGFAAPYPGRIITQYLAEGSAGLLCQKRSFLCAEPGVVLDIALTKRLGAGLFGGEGFILQHVRGSGRVFLHASGHIMQKSLQDETLFIDSGCLLAFSASLDYDIQKAGSVKSALFGGEGTFLAKLSGHGTAWVQSLPLNRAQRHALHNTSADSNGESSLVGSLSRLFSSH